MTRITLIAAMTESRVIGMDGNMPWHIRSELQHFKQTTMGKPMIMGRKTFDSIGRRLLPGRQTIVLSRASDLNGEGYEVASSMDQALQQAGEVEEVMIVGGAGIYQQFLPLADRLCLSVVSGHHKGDTFFPEFDEGQWQLSSETSHPEFVVRIYERKKIDSLNTQHRCVLGTVVKN